MKQSMEPGKPAFLKQAATWSLQLDTPFEQPVLSFQSGSGLEHHLPHPYSHFEGMVTVDVQRALDVVLVEVGLEVVGQDVVVVLLVGDGDGLGDGLGEGDGDGDGLGEGDGDADGEGDGLGEGLKPQGCRDSSSSAT